MRQIASSNISAILIDDKAGLCRSRISGSGEIGFTRSESPRVRLVSCYSELVSTEFACPMVGTVGYGGGIAVSACSCRSCSDTAVAIVRLYAEVIETDVCDFIGSEGMSCRCCELERL